VISPYLFRLLCLGFACFFLIQLALGLAVAVSARPAIRLAGRLRPRPAARLLLALRLFPAGFALFVVAAICVPSYFRLEPEAASEQVGFPCLAAAFLGAAIWEISMARVLRAFARCVRHLHHCRLMGRSRRLPGEPSPVCIMDHATPFVMLAGIIRTQLVISRSVLRALSAAQLAVVLRHERAHRVSRDNLKRLLVLMAPDILPFVRIFGTLERAWARFTEWAADDHAVSADPRRSVDLAAALVRVARLGSAPPLPQLATSLLAGGQDLGLRVDRLLRAAPPCEPPRRRVPAPAAAAAVLLAAGLGAALAPPAMFYQVHLFLEHLIH
jgi:Zn-dependent protease with chaperone function